MVGLLVLAILVLPFVELAVIIQVSEHVGVLDTLTLLVLCSVGGAWLVKREGLGVLRRMQNQLAAGELPAMELVNGALILVAGALLIVPGFVSDVMGLLLLLPPSRAVVRGLLMRRFERRIRSAIAVPFGAVRGAGGAVRRVNTGTATYDVVDVHEVHFEGPGHDDEPPEIGRY